MTIKELERLFLACECKDEEEHKMSKFVVGLNRNIGKKVKEQWNEDKRKSTKGFNGDKLESMKAEEETEFITPKDKMFKAINDSIKASVSGSKKLTPGWQAMRDKVCFKCFGSGHVRANCPNKVIVNFEDHYNFMKQFNAIHEEEERLLTMRESKE
ncbi:Gag polyprotein [Bienertia sinuspersici]